MKSVFADTFHFLALLKADDPYHSRAVELHRVRWRKLVTTDCVLLETGDACCEPQDHGDFLALYDSLPRDSRIEIVRLTPELLERGVTLFRNRADKNWPLTDCISFVVMEHHGLSEALTADRHFEQAGFKTLLAS
jgi:predicted nucleic acid-binding protein